MATLGVGDLEPELAILPRLVAGHTQPLDLGPSLIAVTSMTGLKSPAKVQFSRLPTPEPPVSSTFVLHQPARAVRSVSASQTRAGAASMSTTW
jgi:hypothetical protein